MPTDREQDDIEWLYSQSGSSRPQSGRSQPKPASRQSRLDANVAGRPNPSPQPSPAQLSPDQVRPVPPPQRRGPIPGLRPPRRRRYGLIGLAVVLAVLIFTGVYLVMIPVNAWAKVQKIADDPGGERPAQQPGNTFLLVGTDARGGLSPEEGKALGVDSETAGARTDSMMLLYVPPQGKSVLISLPRDSFVPIPGKGKNKLNAAFAWGGAPLLIATVEQATGLRVDGYMEVGFGGFARVVDAIGGVEMCLKEEFPDEGPHEGIPAGCHKLTPRQALWYVRQRHADPTQDLGRVQRQRQFLGEVMKQSMTPETVLNPGKYTKITEGLAKGIAVGEHTQLGDVVAVAWGMRTFSSGGGVSVTIPIANANAMTAAGSSVLWDAAQCKQLFGELAAGDTSKIDRFVKK